jgi:hypothetical protein
MEEPAMTRLFSVLALTALMIAAMSPPAAASSSGGGGITRYRVSDAGLSYSARQARRAERFHRWCTRSVKPYRNNVTFSLREARGCFRG